MNHVMPGQVNELSRRPSMKPIISVRFMLLVLFWLTGAEAQEVMKL